MARFRLSPALIAPCLVACLALGACSTPSFLSNPPQTRGNMVEADQLAQLVPGTSTKQDAIALLGSPTAKASFDENTWLYIGEVTKPKIAATNTVEDQNVVALSFDSKGVLRHVEHKTQADSVPVTVIARTTPAPGTDASFLQMLLGNIGRFNPGSSTSPTTGGGAGRGVSGNY